MPHALFRRGLVPLVVAASAAAQPGWYTYEFANEPISGTPDQPTPYTFVCPLEVFEFGPSLWIEAEILDPSRAGELNITLEHESGFLLSFDGSDGNPHDLGPADIDLGFDDEPGRWQAFVTVDIFGQIPSVEGAWTVSVYDEFDSLPGPEGTLSMSVTFWAPAPGTPVILLSAAAATGRNRNRNRAQKKAPA
jgi:hypothetical protein